MPEEISPEESFSALLGIVLAQPTEYSAGLAQSLQKDEERQGALSAVLFNACGAGDEILAQLAIRLGAEVNYNDNTSFSCLGEATKRGSVAILKLLLERGADVHRRHTALFTPAHWAARANHLECLKLLLEHGADLRLKDRYGRTPRDLAEEWATKEMLKVIDEWIAVHPE